MRPETAIAPTRLVRRPGAKRWHITATPRNLVGHKSKCGQSLRQFISKTAYNAEEVTCTECIVAAIHNWVPTRSTR